MEYTNIHLPNIGWVIGKMQNGDAVRLSESEIDEIVRALNVNEEFENHFLNTQKSCQEELPASASESEGVEKPH
jgi:hypothetical protein